MDGQRPEEDEAEAFVVADGGAIDGQVLADLEGDAAPEAASDGEDEGEEGEGPSGAGGGDDLEMGEDDSIHTFEGHAGGVYAAAWSPVQPDLVATGGGDDRAFLWRVGQEAFEQTGGAVLELSGHTDTVSCLAFNKDGSLLATGGMDGRVKVWDVATGACRHSLEGPGDAIEWVEWHPRGMVVLAGAADFTAWMWLAGSGACMQVFSGHSGPVTCGGFTPDGKRVVTGGGEGDASLRLWEPKEGHCQLLVAGHPYHSAGLTCMALHPDSSAAITGSEDGSAKVVNLTNGRVVATLVGSGSAGAAADAAAAEEEEEPAGIEAVAFSPALPGVALTAALDGSLTAWDVASAAPRATCSHPDGITRLVHHPSQPLAITGCLDGVVRCWDVRTGACVRSWRGHGDAVQALAASPDGRYVLSGSEDGTARVFSLNE